MNQPEAIAKIGAKVDPVWTLSARPISPNLEGWVWVRFVRGQVDQEKMIDITRSWDEIEAQIIEAMAILELHMLSWGIPRDDQS